MLKVFPRFVSHLEDLSETLLGLKQYPCPGCGTTETLNCHSILYGNDPESAQGELVQRGQRVWCSNRGQRGGCGRSFSLFIADVLPRHTVRASHLWSLVQRWLQGGSLKAAIEALALPFGLETLYHLLARMRARLTAVRTALCREQSPAVSAQTDPLLATAEHLRDVFSQSQCPWADFQRHFQQALLA